MNANDENHGYDESNNDNRDDCDEGSRIYAASGRCSGPAAGDSQRGNDDCYASDGHRDEGDSASG